MTIAAILALRYARDPSLRLVLLMRARELAAWRRFLRRRYLGA